MGRKDLTNERQDSILDAAEYCIAKYGFQGATLNKIASEAGINRGLIHHYIGKRDEVVQLVVERLLERYQSSFEAYVASQPEEDRAEVVVRYFFDAWFELAPEDDVLIMELLAESERDPHIRKLLQKIYDRFETMIATELTRLFPKADKKELRSVSYSLMLLAISHATIIRIGLPQSKKANVRSIAENLVNTLQ